MTTPPLCPSTARRMEICRTALGENHPDYAASLNNLAMLYQAMGDYAAALPLYRQALEIRRTALGENHPHYATSLNNLAGLYRAMGDYAAALPLYRQAMEITSHYAGREPSTLRHQPEQPGAVVRGRWVTKPPLSPSIHKALEICRTALGENHPDYATSLNNLAGLYNDMGDHAAALPLSRQALEIAAPRWARTIRTMPAA